MASLTTTGTDPNQQAPLQVTLPTQTTIGGVASGFNAPTLPTTPTVPPNPTPQVTNTNTLSAGANQQQQVQYLAQAASQTTGVNATANSASLAEVLANVTQPNALNAYYNPTYHFRLFVCGDTDILDQASNSMYNITSGVVPQVTIAESGVTGSSITNVEIETQPNFTGCSKTQSMTGMVMTVTDPLGMSFLDGLVDAARVMKGRNFQNMPYFVELSFRAYDENGNALQPANLPNGGVWIWQVSISDILTKINEGGGVFTLSMVGAGDHNGMLLCSPGAVSDNHDEQRLPNQAMTVSGATVAAVFQDFVTKLNNGWKNSTGGALVTVAIVTHPIAIGPSNALGIDPGTFTMKPQATYQSSQRTWQFDGGDSGSVTCHIPPNATIADSITAIIQSTEQAQALMKDVPIVTQVDTDTSTVNAKKYRDTVVFGVEADISNTGFDTTTNRYMKTATFHVVAHSAQHVVLSQTQLANASTPDVQNAMVNNYINRGLISKRYDYIYTGLNTEILNFDVSWNFAWTAQLPALAGSRAGYNSAAVHGVQNPGNPKAQGTLYQASDQLDVTPDNSVTTPPSAAQSGSPGGSTGGSSASGGQVASDSAASSPAITTPQTPASTNTNTNTPPGASGGEAQG